MREATCATRRAQDPGRSVRSQLEQLIVGPSSALVSLRAELESLALARPRAVLVLGETGVGKDLVARALQLGAEAPEGPLEVFNCPAVPSDHLEAELFGTTRGAYPGALDRPGAAERADGGILLLDEIGCMPAVHQAKLLRLLENAEARRLGGRSPYRVRLQVVAATNVDLHRAIADGRFRADLYYRLVQDGVLRLPALRERPEDIAPLAERFIREMGSEAQLANAALERLRAHDWPGNVRELRAVVRSASHLAPTPTVRAEDVTRALERIGQRGPLGEPLRPFAPRADGFHARTLEVRRQLLVEALQVSAGNRTRAGVLLGLHRRQGEAAEPEESVELGLAARKRAHRKFDYWWRRLVEGAPAAPEAGGVGVRSA